MIDFVETHVEFILEFLHVLFPLDEESVWPRNSTLSEQYVDSLHDDDEIAENNGSGRSMENRIGRDIVSSQLV
jgi:hypothetical protein